MTTQLTLFIPALPGSRDDCPQPKSWVPALETFLARARCHRAVSGGSTAALFQLFGFDAWTEGGYAVAALTGLYDGIDTPNDGLWLRADPVHLAADRDRVVMAGYYDLSVRPTESDRLAQAFNNLFGEDGLRLHTPTPQRWYLRVPQAPDFNASAVEKVVGQDIDPHLPRGEGALRWHRLLNEVQMLFHASDVNQNRQQQGELPVNSLWLWGGGRLPEAPSMPWSCVWGNDVISRALARYCQVKEQSLPPTAGEWLEYAGDGPHLVVMEGARHGDRATWQAFVDGVENEWIAPLLAAVKSARVSEVRLVTGDGNAYCLTAKSLRRWWRHRRPLSYFQSAE